MRPHDRSAAPALLEGRAARASEVEAMPTMLAQRGGARRGRLGRPSRKRPISANRCAPVDGACEVAADCCSLGCSGGLCTAAACAVRACADDGTGVTSCQFLGGCRPFGELCRDDSDCCSDPAQPGGGVCMLIAGSDTGLGRCGNPGGCAPAGEICAVSGSPTGTTSAARAGPRAWTHVRHLRRGYERALVHTSAPTSPRSGARTGRSRRTRS